MKVLNESNKLIIYSIQEDNNCYEDIIKFIKNQLKRLINQYNIKLTETLEIIIYPDIILFQRTNNISLEKPWFVSKIEENIIKIVSPFNPGTIHSYESILKIFIHELMNILILKLNPKIPNTHMWFVESLCVYEANLKERSQINANQFLHLKGKFLSILNSKKAVYYNHLDMAFVFVDFLYSNHKQDLLIEIINNPSKIIDIINNKIDNFENKMFNFLVVNYQLEQELGDHYYG